MKSRKFVNYELDISVKLSSIILLKNIDTKLLTLFTSLSNEKIKKYWLLDYVMVVYETERKEDRIWVKWMC